MAALSGVVVIGAGSTAERRHLPVWRGLRGARLVGVASRDPQRAQRAAERYGASRTYKDWREALHDPDVHIVDICTPHPLHAEIAIAAARAGKHVLCEKPLAPDLASARAMAAAADASNVILMPFQNMRLLPAASTARALVASGAIGNVSLIRGAMTHGGPDAADARRAWFLQPEAGGGAVLDLGPHLFDLVSTFRPSPPQAIRATLRYEEGLSVERDGLVEARFADGVLASLVMSWSQVAGRDTVLTVQGSGGTLRVTLLHGPDPSPGAPAAPLMLARGRGLDIEVSYPEPAGGTEPCSVMLRAVQGERVDLSAEDGVAAIAWVDAAYRSHHAGGGWVDVQT